MPRGNSELPGTPVTEMPPSPAMSAQAIFESESFHDNLRRSGELAVFRAEFCPKPVQPAQIYAMQWLEFPEHERGALLEEMMVNFCGWGLSISQDAFSNYHMDRPAHLAGYCVWDEIDQEYKPVPQAHYVVRLYEGHFQILDPQTYKRAYVPSGEVCIR